MAELTPLAVAALGVLMEGPRHPYEINQILMHRRRDKVIKIRPSSLYHAIDRLEKDGYIASLGCGRDGNRPERTTYVLSELGKQVLSERLAQMLAKPAPEFPEIDFALSEAHGLNRGEVAELIGNRIEIQQALVQELQETYDEWVGKPTPRQYFIHIPYRIRMLQAEIEWLSELRHELDSGQIEWLERDPR